MTEQNESTGRESPALLSNVDDRGILTLTLNRPNQFNPLSEHMLDKLQHELDSLNPKTRLVIIAATGKAFCAGHDLREMRAHADEEAGGEQWQKALFKKCSHFMQTLLDIPQPVVAKVQGMATAAGCQLVANCDLAIASDDSQFGVSGINLGLFCSTPSVALSRNLSRKHAFQMLMTGDFIDAQRAVEWGLLNQCVPVEDLDDAVEQLCSKIIAKPRVAVTTGKNLFYKQLEAPLSEAYSMAGEAMACNMMDREEGIDAFFEKRKPTWNDS